MAVRVPAAGLQVNFHVAGNGLLIFKGLKFTGFWLNRWRKNAGTAQLRETYAALAAHLKAGTLFTPVHETYPLARIVEAVEAAGKDQRGGKVLIDLAA